MGEDIDSGRAAPTAARRSRLKFAEPEAFAAIGLESPGYVKALVDYSYRQFLVDAGHLMQVYEELLAFAHWVRGFEPRNVLEIGTTGTTFFILSRLASGKKAAIDIRDMRPRLHACMFGHDWCFFHGNSQTEEMRRAVCAFCDSFDLIFIDADHRYNGVRRDFELYRPLLSDRGVIVFHDVDPDHVFKGGAAGEVYKFWADLDTGSKTNLCCSRTTSHIKLLGATAHFGGIGIWSP